MWLVDQLITPRLEIDDTCNTSPFFLSLFLTAGRCPSRERRPFLWERFPRGQLNFLKVSGKKIGKKSWIIPSYSFFFSSHHYFPRYHPISTASRAIGTIINIRGERKKRKIRALLLRPDAIGYLQHFFVTCNHSKTPPSWHEPPLVSRDTTKWQRRERRGPYVRESTFCQVE
jgi:hypothetical protein